MKKINTTINMSINGVELFEGITSKLEADYLKYVYESLEAYQKECDENLEGFREYLYETDNYTDDSYELKQDNIRRECEQNMEKVLYEALDRGVDKKHLRVLAYCFGVDIPEIDEDYEKFVGNSLNWTPNGPELGSVGVPKWSSDKLEFTIEKGADGCYLLIEQNVEGHWRGIEIDCIPSVTEGIELAESCLEHKIPLFWNSPYHEYDGEEYPCIKYERVQLNEHTNEYFFTEIKEEAYIPEAIIDIDEYLEDDFIIDDEILLEDYEPFSRDIMAEEIWRCSNGILKFKGSEYHLNELHTWFYELGYVFEGKKGVYNTPVIELAEDDEGGIFHLFGDLNDGKYNFVHGNIVHHTAAKTFGAVVVECEEDCGYVWRNFEDFDEVEVEFYVFK